MMQKKYNSGKSPSREEHWEQELKEEDHVVPHLPKSSVEMFAGVMGHCTKLGE